MKTIHPLYQSVSALNAFLGAFYLFVLLTLAPTDAPARDPDSIFRAAMADLTLDGEWHSPRVDVYAWHPKIEKGQDDSLIKGITEVVGFARGRSVVEVIFLTDAQTSQFPDGKALWANLALWSGDVGWVQMSDSGGNQLWKIDGQTAVLMPENNAIVILNDDWVSEVTMEKLVPFIAEVTAWSGV